MSPPEAGSAVLTDSAVDEPPVGGSSRLARVFDGLLRIAGGLVSVVAAVVTGVVELSLTPLRVAGVPVGLAVVVAVVANAAIGWFAVQTVGRRWAVAPPWAVWTLLMFFAAGVRTDEGDQLMAGDDWVGLLVILLGSLAFAVHAYRLVLRGQSGSLVP